MKSIIRKFVGAALLLALPLSFTSCDDILGKWDKPIPPAAITLKNALDNGAKVEFSYKIGDTEYTAAFVKDGDKYNLVGGGDPKSEKLEYDAAKNRLKYSYYYNSMEAGENPYYLALEVFLDINTTSYFTINMPGYENYTFDGKIKIKDSYISVPNACPKTAIIDYSSASISLYVNYKEGETWEDVYNRYADCGHAHDMLDINATDNSMEVILGSGTGSRHSLNYKGVATPIIFKTAKVGKKDDADYPQHYDAIQIVMAVG